MGEDPFFGKVAKSGRSAALLNMDWMIRNASERTKHPPPATGDLVNEVLTSVESGEVRIANHHGQLARERRRKLKVEYSKVLMGRLIAFWEQAANRICNLNYQQVRIAFAHLKAQADMRVYKRTPMGRYLIREREQRSA